MNDKIYNMLKEFEKKINNDELSKITKYKLEINKIKKFKNGIKGDLKILKMKEEKILKIYYFKKLEINNEEKLYEFVSESFRKILAE